MSRTNPHQFVFFPSPRSHHTANSHSARHPCTFTSLQSALTSACSSGARDGAALTKIPPFHLTPSIQLPSRGLTAGFGLLEVNGRSESAELRGCHALSFPALFHTHPEFRPQAGKAAPLNPKPGPDASPPKPRDGSVRIEVPRAIILVKSSMPGSHQRAQALPASNPSWIQDSRPLARQLPLELIPA